MSKLLNKSEKFLYIGGSLSGKREFSDEFMSKRYFICKNMPALDPCYDYLPITTMSTKSETYYPRSMKLFDSKHNEKTFYFMVNDPYMSDFEIIEKLINGHRGVRKKR